MTRNSRATVTALMAVLAFGCSDFATAPDRQPTQFTITPDTTLLVQGETVQFEYTLLDQDGEPYGPVPGWARPLWTSSDAGILEFGREGEGWAVGPGAVEAVAELAGLTATARVRVNPPEVQVSVPWFHITQSVQRPAGGVPLLAGRPGLLRVYVQSDGPNFFQPSVLATFYRNGSPVHAALLELEAEGVPDTVEAGDLALSFDAEIPGAVLQPGTSIVLEVDRDGILPASPESVLRVPATSTQPLDVADPATFRLRFVPVDQSLNGLQSRITPEEADLRFRRTQEMLPLGATDVDVRARYTTDLDLRTEAAWSRLLEDIAILRLDDGSSRYYYGALQLPRRAAYGGLGYVGYPVSIGSDISSRTITHELGHNLSLRHAPCAPSDLDPEQRQDFENSVDREYPYRNGVIGQWGWDRARPEMLLDPERTYDVMSYCLPAWISDYHSQKIVAYRDTSQFDAASGAAGMSASRQDVLLVQAMVEGDELRLGPALETVAVPSLPRAGGSYTLEGLDSGGGTLFTLSFEPLQVDHLAAAHFSAAVPAGMAQIDRLTTLRVTGPEGVVERSRQDAAVPIDLSLEERGAGGILSWDARSYPLAVVRDRASGQIVAIGRTGRLELSTDVGAVGVTLSDGVRSHPVELNR
ncbi:MAG: M66 family metalloprotease [Longimicrobiales bacterium]|nr:M66 family metalloprotease [Longimicrobiales bacterium]